MFSCSYRSAFFCIVIVGFGHGILEFPDSTAKIPCDFRYLSSAEKEKNDEEYNDKLGYADGAEHTHLRV